MTEIIVKDNEPLDEVVEKLIKEREKGNKAFAIIEGVRLESDTITLDSAYQDYCGCSKEEFECQYDGARAFNGMKKMFAVSKENVLNAVKWARALFLTKDEKTYCPLAEEYIENMEKYSEYCEEDMKEDWNKKIRELVYNAGRIKDEDYLMYLMVYELAGEIMKAISEGKSLEELREMTDNAGCNEYIAFYTGDVVSNFSPNGLDYYEKIALNYNNKGTTK